MDGIEIAEGDKNLDFIFKFPPGIKRFRRISKNSTWFMTVRIDKEIDMRQSITKGRGRKKSKGFDPNRDYLNQAMKDYLDRGGKIRKIVELPEDAEQNSLFSEQPGYASEVMSHHY